MRVDGRFSQTWSHILFPSWVVLCSHCIYSIPILGCVMYHCIYSIPIMGCVMFPLHIFNSHHGLCYVPIVYILFPSWVVLCSHRISSAPIMGCVIFPLYALNSHCGLRYTPVYILLLYTFYNTINHILNLDYIASYVVSKLMCTSFDSTSTIIIFTAPLYCDNLLSNQYIGNWTDHPFLSHSSSSLFSSGVP